MCGGARALRWAWTAKGAVSCVGQRGYDSRGGGVGPQDTVAGSGHCLLMTTHRSVTQHWGDRKGRGSQRATPAEVPIGGKACMGHTRTSERRTLRTRWQAGGCAAPGKSSAVHTPAKSQRGPPGCMMTAHQVPCRRSHLDEQGASAPWGSCAGGCASRRSHRRSPPHRPPAQSWRRQACRSWRTHGRRTASPWPGRPACSLSHSMMPEAAALVGADPTTWSLGSALVRRVRKAAPAAGLRAGLRKVCRRWVEGA